MKRRRARGRMLDIGPYYQADADARLQGIGEVPWPLPSLISGTTWPTMPGWPAGLPGLPGLTLPPPGGLTVPGLPPLGIPTQLLIPYLQSALLLTPWAWMPSDTTWQEVPHPEFNVALIDGATLDSIAALAGPPGWVAALFQKPLSPAAASALFSGTPYDLFSAEAAYSQADIAAVPKIVFVYWGQLSPAWQSRKKLPAQSILAAGGRPMVGVQLEYPATASRGKPSSSFGDAYRQQVPPPPVGRPNGVAPPPGERPPPPPGGQPPPPPPHAPSGKTPWLALGATALGLAGLGWIITRRGKH